MKNLSCFLILSIVSFVSSAQKMNFDTDYEQLKISKKEPLTYSFPLKKGTLYQFTVMQQGVDVEVSLRDAKDSIWKEIDSPNGGYGPEKFDITPSKSGTYTLKINAFDDPANPENGDIGLFVHEVSAAELKRKAEIQQELKTENEKTVTAIDVIHFWEAYDKLKLAKNYKDSLACIQTIYLDRATNGFESYINLQGITAKEYLIKIKKCPKFFQSIRTNTLVSEKISPKVELIFTKLKNLYPNYTPMKVCFFVGVLYQGATVSNGTEPQQYVYACTEVIAGDSQTDVSELSQKAFADAITSGTDVAQKLINTVSHECVHIQQKNAKIDSNRIVCPLLQHAMMEGAADFIGDMISGGQNNPLAHIYGNAHEKELWLEFKSNLCGEVGIGEKWFLFNFKAQDRPADLGYFIGNKIAEAYYNHSKDKTQAIIDIIEINNPILFLDKSGYDNKQ